MIGKVYRLIRACPGLLAVLIVGLAAGAASAESITFRNDCKSPVVVQAASVYRGVLRRSRPYLLRPGARSPAITLVGDKVVTIYDGKVPNRVLYQGAVPASKTNRSYRV